MDIANQHNPCFMTFTDTSIGQETISQENQKLEFIEQPQKEVKPTCIFVEWIPQWNDENENVFIAKV